MPDTKQPIKITLSRREPRRTATVNLTEEMNTLLGDLTGHYYPFPIHYITQIALRIGLRQLVAHPEEATAYRDHWTNAKSKVVSARRKAAQEQARKVREAERAIAAPAKPSQGQPRGRKGASK